MEALEVHPMARLWKKTRRTLEARTRSFRLRRRKVLDAPGLRVERIGGARGWTLWADPIRPESIVYSFGVGRNVDWDLEMIRRFGVVVHAFEPMRESMRWVRAQPLPERFVLHEYGLSDHDGTLSFYPPRTDLGHYSSEVRRHTQPTDVPVEGEVRRLSTIMRSLRHEHVDVLKLDIEGSEFAVIPDLLREGLPIGQLLLELHYHFPSHSFGEALQGIADLKRLGMQCFHVSERGLEFGFVHRSLLAGSWPEVAGAGAADESPTRGSAGRASAA
jgi:FkbM family methyltransferase